MGGLGLFVGLREPWSLESCRIHPEGALGFDLDCRNLQESMYPYSIYCGP